MYCGVPIGAALAAALGFFRSRRGLADYFLDWRRGPAAADPVADALAAGVAGVSARGASAPLRTLFAPGQAAATLLLWLGYFFTPAGGLYADQLAADAAGGPGIPRQPGGGGDVLSADRRRLRARCCWGRLMDKLTPLRMSLLIYSGILASLLALGSASSLTGMLLAGFVAGLFATGGQSVLLRSGAAFLSRGHPRHQGGHRRGGGASWGDERPAAGRQDAGPRHRRRRGDGGLGAGHCAGRRGGVLADASPAARGHGLICIRRSGKKNAGPPPALSASPWPKVRHHSLTLIVPMAYTSRLLNAIPGIRHAFLDVHETAAFPYAELAPVKLVHGNEVHHYRSRCRRACTPTRCLPR